MGVLKYTKADGQVVSLNVYKVNNVVVTQEKGQSEADVMSQKTVTDFLDNLLNEITETNNLVSEKADNNNVYSKTETDTKLSSKANTADVYNKTEVDNKLSAKANANDVYNKTETDNKISVKANTNDVYNKTEIDNKLSDKANNSDIPTKVSELENDSNYLTTHQSLTSYATKSEMTTADNAIISDISDLDDRVAELEEGILVIDGGEY